MKFILINPDYGLYGDPPLGLAYLAAYLRKKCDFLRIRILDQISEEEIFKIIKTEKPELIGLTAVSQNFYKVKEIARGLKKISPESILIIGGVHITTSPESFKDSPFDLAVIGEGEIVSHKLVVCLNESNFKIDTAKLSKIKGLLIKDNGKIISTGHSEFLENLEENPLPARDLLNMKYYRLPRFSLEEGIDPAGSLITSRGCPYNCKFCSSSALWQRKFRFFSAKRVAKEILLLYKEYGYRNISIYDDLFSINKERLKEIVEQLAKRGLLGKIRFEIYGRANCFTEEIAYLLKRMGVKNITFGFETGSKRMLSYLKGSGIKIEDSINAIKVARKYGLNPRGFFMIGSPTETLSDVRKTMDFIRTYLKKDFIIYQTIAFPGTEVWAYAIKNKIYSKNFYEYRQKEFIDINLSLLLSKDISKEDFARCFKEIRSLQTKNSKFSFLKKILRIRLKHIKNLLSLEFLKKAYILRGQLIKRIR